jgi:asparagine synthase (glutamine-hydrolysing)
MCGISAIYRFTSISDSDKLKLSLMNREMNYRGPDESDIWNDSICGLAHTRLSIIGLKKGKQPISNEDNSLVLICNGEIYNYIELKEELQLKGHIFKTDSDNETILHLYEEYGIKCLEHLRGIFAFCLWDTTIKQLFVARDRIGEKTIYFAQIQTGIAFSTELKALLKNYVDKPRINERALAECIRYNHPIDLKNTWIEQIKRLEPGEYALIDNKGMEISRYWERDFSPTFAGSFEEAKNETLRLMRESVQICLRSDVPVAVLLSGGIDSSAVATFAKETGSDVHVLTAGYKGDYSIDEREIAKRFSKEKDFIYNEIELEIDDFRSIFDKYLNYIDEPVCDVAAIPQWALYNKAKKLGYKVLLGGLGGDELFYGYTYHNKLTESLQLNSQHRDLFPWNGPHKKLMFLKYILKNWKHVLYAGYPYKIDDTIPVNWTYEDYKKFANNGSFSLKSEVINFSKIDVHYSFSDHANIDNVYDFMFSRFMTSLCLYLGDRLGMGNSIEIRSPFVDYKLVEFISSLPIHMKYPAKEPKWFLKETLKGIVPDYILHAPKRGFTPPFDFIKEISRDYQYKMFNADHCFYNSLLADRLIYNLFGK